MYSGTTIRKGSGKVIGTHQKIDRVARRRLQKHIPSNINFPTVREIIRFEGLDGPDGIKRKSPSKDEPWHYINPTDPNDRALLDLIAGHENNLIAALTNGNRERAAFEAAWLAHAITDGLTPAHHHSYKEDRDALLGESADLEGVVFKKLLSSGNSWFEKLKNNYEFFKPNGQGIGTAHLYFELGVAISTKALLFENVKLSHKDRKIAQKGGIVPIYLNIAQEIYDLGMYDEFLQAGWTTKLARQVKNKLIPTIIHTVLMSWYYCAWRASENSKEKIVEREKTYGKLVRDRIPKIISRNGENPKTRILSDEEFKKEIYKKLQEEVNEFLVDDNLEELADILEVIHGILKMKKVKPVDLEKIRQRKFDTRGGFLKRIFLEDVEK